MNTTRWILVLLMCFLSSTNPSPAQWAQFSNLGGRRVFSLAASGSNLFAGTDFGVFLSKDGGVSWTPRNAGLPNLVVTSLAWNGPRIFAAMDQWVYRSADTGVTWTLSNNGLTASSISSLALKDTILFVSGFAGVFRSSDNGTNWTAVNVGLTLSLVNCFAVQNNYLFAGGERIFRSSNDGTTWTAMNSGLATNSVTAFAATGTYLFAGTYAGGIYVSTDNGQQWMPANRGIEHARVITLGVYQQTIDHQTIVAYTSSGVHFSQNAGATWIPFTDGLPSGYSIRAFLVSGTNLLAGAEQGVWGRPLAELASTTPPSAPNLSRPLDAAVNVPEPVDFAWLASDNATSFHLQISKNPVFTQMVVDSSNIVAFGASITLEGNTTYFWKVSAINFYGEGSFSAVRTFSTAKTTGIKSVNEGIPLGYTLSQNYPNPFNPSTRIAFSVPKTTRVRLNILDALGREVALLANGEKTAGVYELQWEAGNLPSGIYFYRLQAGEYRETKRMILLK